MSKFSIDTDKVSSIASDLSNLSSSSSSIGSSVSGYDTTNEDGFDFSGAKSAIENNVEGMKTKVSNTSVLLDAVVSTHSSLQDSVSSGDSSGGSSDYGSYSYGGGSYGGGSSGGGSNYVGGGYGSSAPQAEISSSQGSTGKAISGEVKKVAKNEVSAVSLSSLDVEDPLAEKLVESVLKENPSAYDKLKEELGKVESTIANAESALNEELDVVLSSNSIKTTSPDGIIAESFGNTLLVIEASTKTPGITKYVKDVNEVAKEYKLEVRFLELDDIIDYSSAGSYNERINDDVLAINEPSHELKDILEVKIDSESEEEKEKISSINDYSQFKSGIYQLEENEENKENQEVEETIFSEKQEENKKEDENNEETPQQEEIINEDEKELEEQQKEQEHLKENQEDNQSEKVIENRERPIVPGTIPEMRKEEKKEEEKKEPIEKTDNNKTVDSSKIKDKSKYDKLTSIPTRDNVKNDILNSPVTLILKNNLICNAETGILSKERVKMLIENSGIN